MFAIVTDTAANLNRDWLNDNQVHTVIFHYTVEGADQTCPDPSAFDPHAYYTAIRQGARVRTSQITPHQYLECLRPLLEAGQDVLFVGLSSGVSGSFASALSAAEE
ncbi:MAG: DegV family protein, partial [Candidatus Limiplasma sp.]|nr:DegV family protein [Candidatus Limiplasma sp.]